MMQRALAIVLALAALGVGLSVDGRAAPPKSALRLTPFGSCGELLAHLKRRAAPRVGAWGIGGGLFGAGRVAVGAPESRAAAPPTADDFSGTNVQEDGVDEPDLAKSTGSYLYVAAGETLRVVDIRARVPRLVGSLQLPAGGAHHLLHHGDRLLVLSQAAIAIDPVPAPGAERSSIAPLPGGTQLAEVDVSTPSRPRLVRTMTLEGEYVAARLTGGTVRVVVSSLLPRAVPFQPPSGSSRGAIADAVAHNRAVVMRTGIRAWLPRYEVRGRSGRTLADRPLAQCRAVRRPASDSGLGLLTVLTIDLGRGLSPVDTDSLLTDGRIVYASAESLYVATEQSPPQPLPGRRTAAPPSTTTTIHKFDIRDPARTHYRASGQVAGVMLSQWSFSEHQGVLRVATTEQPSWWQPQLGEESESFVTTLRERDGRLATVGRVGGLGRGERVYAVRFMGERGYVVTFRQVDPLYTLDLADPSNPRVRGELKIPGYSAYLHPLGADLLLGVGQDVTADGRLAGTQISVFDVSDPSAPKRLHVHPVGGMSEAEWDHHAFLYWEPERLAVLPTQTGAAAYRVGRAGISLLGTVEDQTRRAFIARGALYTVSESGVRASDLRTFAPLGGASF